jgi:hypothetical protein
MFVLYTNVWGKSNTSLSTSSYFWAVAASCYGYACNRQGLASLFRIKINGIELNIGKILEENLVQSAFQPTLGDKFTFQQDNNLKHKAKYILDIECSWVA